jgi:hypothetical protein
VSFARSSRKHQGGREINVFTLSRRLLGSATPAGPAASRMKWTPVISVVAVAAVLAGPWIFPSGALRYRMTVEVEADGEMHTGSGVVEVGFARQGWSDEASLGVLPSVTGQAVVVDLAARGVLFVLLKRVSSGQGDNDSAPSTMVIKEFQLAPSVGSLKGEMLRRLSSISARADVPFDSLPMLVRFRDLNDPKSVERVDPNNLEKSFGPGTSLVRATMETVPVGVRPFNLFGVSGTPITIGIEKTLPWLSDRRGKPGYLHGPRFDDSPDALNLSGLEFSTVPFNCPMHFWGFC